MAAPRDVLKGLMNTRHNLSSLHCGETIQFLHGNLDQSPPPTHTLLFHPEPVGLRASEAQNGQGESELPVQWNLWSKNIPSGLLGVIVSETIPFPTP